MKIDRSNESREQGKNRRGRPRQTWNISVSKIMEEKGNERSKEV